MAAKQTVIRYGCHRCGRLVGLRGRSNVLAGHAPAPGYVDYDGVCMGAGENPCIVLHRHPCRPVTPARPADATAEKEETSHMATQPAQPQPEHPPTTAAAVTAARKPSPKEALLLLQLVMAGGRSAGVDGVPEIAGCHDAGWLYSLRVDGAASWALTGQGRAAVAEAAPLEYKSALLFADSIANAADGPPPCNSGMERSGALGDQAHATAKGWGAETSHLFGIWMAGYRPAMVLEFERHIVRRDELFYAGNSLGEPLSDATERAILERASR